MAMGSRRRGGGETAFGVGGKEALPLCAIDGILKLCPADETNDDFGGEIFYDWEALVFVLAEKLLGFGHGEVGGGQHGGFAGHGVGDGDVEDVVFFAVEEGEAVEPDHAVGNTAFAAAVADCLGYANHDLHGRLVLRSNARWARLLELTIVGRI